MAEPTIQQIFGTNATQTASLLTISKADLATVGLTASGSNTAESLFTAILMLAKNYLTTTAQELNVDQSVTIAESSFNFRSFQTRNNQQYQQFTYEVNLQHLDPGANVDPDNY